MEPGTDSGSYSSYDDASSDYDELASKLSSKTGPLDDLLLSPHERDWNAEYQAILAKDESYDKQKALSTLANDFIYASKLYAQIILSELFVPIERKTIKPRTALGGIAGGYKFIVQGILFKLAMDNNNLYGSDQNAMKAAGHELKGLLAVQALELRGLHLPLMCLIDYRGFRVVAMSLLPVKGDETIIYGSSDAGKHVHADDPKFVNIMRRLGKGLNLKEHLAGEQRQPIYGPVDIEGHLGSDKRYYLLDFARLLPTQVKIRTDMPRTYLYELLRPELVKSNSVPLSSDALTPLGKFDPNQATHNEEAVAASKRLFTRVIPNFAKTLDDRVNEYGTLTHYSCEKLVEELHRNGINVRHLGFVRMKLTKSAARQIVLTEIVARVLKDEIYEQMRATMRREKAASEEPHKQLVLEFLNHVFVNSPDFWLAKLKSMIASKFQMALSDAERDDSSLSLRTLVDVNALLVRFESIAAVQLRQDAVQVLESEASELVPSDIKELGTRVRVMNSVLHSTAYCVSIEASSRQGTEAYRLYTRAHKLFKEVAAKNANNKSAFYRWGKMLYIMASQPTFKHISRRLLCEGAIPVRAQRLKRAIEIDPTYLEAHITLIDATVEFLLNPTRIENQLFKFNSDTFTKKELHDFYGIISNSMNSIASLEGAQDIVKAKIQLWLATPQQSRFATFLQTALTAPILIAPCLQQCSTILNLELHECSFLTKDTILFMIKNCGNIKSLSINNSPDFDDNCFATSLDYASQLERLELISCEKISCLPPKAMLSLRELSLLTCRMTDAGLAPLAQSKFSNLTSLRLSGLQEMTDAAISKLHLSLPVLENLALSLCVNNRGSSCFCYLVKNPLLSFSNLTSLDLSGCREVSAASVAAYISQATSTLRLLRLDGCTQVDDNALAPLAKNCGNLEFLGISQTTVSSHTLTQIFRSCTKLHTIEMHAMKGSDPSCLEAAFRYCRSLDKIDASYWHVTKEEIISSFKFLTAPDMKGVIFESVTSLSFCNWTAMDCDSLAVLVSKCPNLTFLDASNNHLLDDAFLAVLANSCPKLVKLYLVSLLVITDLGIESLTSKCRNLEVLHIPSAGKISDASLRSLTNCPNLRVLELRSMPKVTNQGIQTLLQKCVKMKFLGLRQCKLVTPEFLAFKLRHSCPNLRIAVEGPKDKPLDFEL